MELVPLKATFAPGEPIALEVTGAGGDAIATVHHLDRTVGTAKLAAGHAILELPPLPIAGYGVEVTTGSDVAATAFDVLADPFARPRYGFVSRYERGRNVAAVVANARRLHLNAIQFYDWMYRHALLVPPDDDYVDPLGRPLSLATVRELAAAMSAAGSAPLAYAAVYAAGRDEWPRWRDAGLYRPDGDPWTLGDNFLWIVDPSDEAWLGHLAAELERAATTCGFAGFHLDQYGAPKQALRRDGSVVDLTDAFPRLISHVRRALPSARLIFNNVNDFPTWTTARAPQDAIYIEVWPPHTRLRHLARLVEHARAVGAGRPVILAAYLSVFAHEEEETAMAAARLTMATIFSHGASHLLAGEDGAVLIDPYYVRHHPAGVATQVMLTQWYDFAVRYGDLLYDNDAVDLTSAIAGGINDDLIVESDLPVSIEPEPGALWLRAIETDHGVVVHLIDLTAESDTYWDAPKRGRRALTGIRLKLRRITGESPRLHLASPELAPTMLPVAVTNEDDHHVAHLPPWRTWALILVPHRHKLR